MMKTKQDDNQPGREVSEGNFDDADNHPCKLDDDHGGGDDDEGEGEEESEGEEENVVADVLLSPPIRCTAG